MGKNTRFKITVDESRMMYVTNSNNVASLSSEWVKEIPIYFNIIKPGQVKDLRNIDSLDKETIRRNHNREAIDNLFYSTTVKMTRTVLMVHGNFKVSYLGQVFAHKIVVSKYYHDNADKKFLRFFRFVKLVTVMNSAWFPRIAYIYKKRDYKETAPVDVQKEDIYFSQFCSYDLTYHVGGFTFTLPKGSHFQNLLTPKDNLINETTPQKINLFSKNIFKLPQETLVKTAINNYIKKLTVSFVNESYFFIR